MLWRSTFAVRMCVRRLYVCVRAYLGRCIYVLCVYWHHLLKHFSSVGFYLQAAVRINYNELVLLLFAFEMTSFWFQNDSKSNIFFLFVAPSPKFRQEWPGQGGVGDLKHPQLKSDTVTVSQNQNCLCHQSVCEAICCPGDNSWRHILLYNLWCSLRLKAKELKWCNTCHLLTAACCWCLPGSRKTSPQPCVHTPTDCPCLIWIQDCVLYFLLLHVTVTTSCLGFRRRSHSKAFLCFWERRPRFGVITC